ncbi:hypothetical protein [Streptomyces sp. NPDC052225]|uniref:hypothetical protein n=1 Tax=Streptomyces sp. NPDC052225 TaxID=3154949 RepID=UPI00342433DA
MTISLERPVDLPRTRQLPAYPATRVTNAQEVGETRRAVLALHVAVDRDMLAAALDLACYSYPDPDSWSLVFIRDSVERQLALDGAFHLWHDSRGFADLLDDPSVHERIEAEYRAIDRAYPSLES